MKETGNEDSIKFNGFYRHTCTYLRQPWMRHLLVYVRNIFNNILPLNVLFRSGVGNRKVRNQSCMVVFFVSIGIGTRMRPGRTLDKVRFPTGEDMFSVLSRPTMGPTQSPIQ